MKHMGGHHKSGRQQGVIMTSYSTQLPYTSGGREARLSSRGDGIGLDHILLPVCQNEHFQIQRVRMTTETSSKSQTDRLDFCEDIEHLMRAHSPEPPKRGAKFRIVSPMPVSPGLRTFFGMDQVEAHQELRRLKSEWAPALDNYWELEWIPAILPSSDPLTNVLFSASLDDAECPNDTWIAAKQGTWADDWMLHQSDLDIGRDIVSHLAIIFAQRRSYLFNPSLACRIHNTLLPSGWLLEENAGSDNEMRGFIIVPLVTLVAARQMPTRQSSRSLSLGQGRRRRREGRRYRDVLTLTILHIPVTVAARTSSNERQDTGHPLTARLRDLEHSEAGTFCGTWDWSPARARRLKVNTDGTEEGSGRSRTYRLYGDLNHYLKHLSDISMSDGIDLPYSPRGWAQVLVSAMLRQVNAASCPQGARKKRWSPMLSAGDIRRKSTRDTDDCARTEDRLHDHLIWALTGGKVSSVFVGPMSLNSALQSVRSTWSNDHKPDATAFEFANYLLEARSDLPGRSTVDERWQLDPSSISFGRDVSSYYVAPRSTLVHVYGLSHQTSNTAMSPTVAAASAWMKRLPLWMVGYISYYGVAISCARTLIAALNEDVDRFSADQSLLSHSSDRLLDAEEIFDFEFAVRSNRDFYHQLEEKDGVLSDFSLLERKVDRVRADAILRREQLLSAAALWLSVTVFASTGLTVLLGSSEDGARWWVGGGLLFVSLIIAAWISWRTKRSH